MMKMMTTDHHNCLNFCEMVGLVWDFLSRDPHALGSFAFYMFDTNKNGYLCPDEITELVECLHHTTAAKHRGVKKITADMCGKKSEIDVDAFHKYCSQHDEVCMLLFGFQNTLWESILGKSFWDNITQRRCSCPEQLTADYVQNLFLDMRAAQAEQLQTEQAETKLEIAKESLSRRRCNDRQERKRTNALYTYFVSKIKWTVGCSDIQNTRRLCVCHH